MNSHTNGMAAFAVLFSNWIFFLYGSILVLLDQIFKLNIFWKKVKNELLSSGSKWSCIFSDLSAKIHLVVLHYSLWSLEKECNLSFFFSGTIILTIWSFAFGLACGQPSCVSFW